MAYALYDSTRTTVRRHALDADDDETTNLITAGVDTPSGQPRVAKNSTIAELTL